MTNLKQICLHDMDPDRYGPSYFREKTERRTLIVPGSVRTVEPHTNSERWVTAFDHVVLEEGVEEIREGAFASRDPPKHFPAQNAAGDPEQGFHKSSLREFSPPEGLKVISEAAFSICRRSYCRCR